MWEILVTNFSLYELFKPHWIVLLTVLSYFYIRKVVRSPLYVVTNKQLRYFFAAVISFYIVQGSPLSVVASHYLFSAHVFQLAISCFLVAPLLILSFPVDFYRRYAWHYRAKLAIKLFAYPWLTLVAFNGLLTLYFIPAVFNFLQANVILYIFAQIILMFNAFLMWWVIINPIPELINFQFLLRAAYIFLASLLLIPIGFFFLIVQKAHFPFYQAVAGDFLPVLTAVYDQQLAGGLLKVIQIASYVIALLLLLLKWGKQEEAKEGTVDDENIRVVQGVVIHLNKNDKTR